MITSIDEQMGRWEKGRKEEKKEGREGRKGYFLNFSHGCTDILCSCNAICPLTIWIAQCKSNAPKRLTRRIMLQWIQIKVLSLHDDTIIFHSNISLYHIHQAEAASPGIKAGFPLQPLLIQRHTCSRLSSLTIPQNENSHTTNILIKSLIHSTS